MSRTLYIELSQMKSSASESIKNDGLFQFGTAQSREPRSLKTKTSKLCWPFNSERRILCWGLYRPPSSNMLLSSPCTAFSQSLSVNSFQWRIREERAGIEKSMHWIRILEKQRNSYHRGLQHRLFKDSSIYAQCTSQFHWAAPSPLPLILRGICPTLQSRAGTFAKFALPVGRAFANPGAIPELLTRTTGSFLSECNYTEDITEKKKKKQINSTVKDRGL